MNNKYIEEIRKELKYYTYRTEPREVFEDAVELLALQVSNSVDFNQWQARKQRIEEIQKSHAQTKESVHFTKIVDLLFQYCKEFPETLTSFSHLYMELFRGKKLLQECFSPISVSSLLAELSFQRDTNPNRIYTLNDCCCGGGELSFGYLRIFQKHGLNYTRNLLITAEDIKRSCVLMTYLQLSFAGAAAIVRQVDVLSQKQYDIFFTPAYILQRERFAEVFKATQEGCEPEQ